MNKPSIIIGTLLGLPCFTSSSVGQNLIENGNFENGLYGWTQTVGADHTTAWATSRLTNRIYANSNGAFSGTAAYVRNGFAYGGVLQQYLHLESGNNYRLQLSVIPDVFYDLHWSDQGLLISLVDAVSGANWIDPVFVTANLPTTDYYLDRIFAAPNSSAILKFTYVANNFFAPQPAIDNITLAAVPEPSAMLLGIISSLALLRRQRF